MSLTDSPAQRSRRFVKRRRSQPHPFMASAGHPSLCAACNSERDELTARGEHIHTRAELTSPAKELAS